MPLISSRKDALTDERCPPWAQKEKAEARCRGPNAPTLQLQMVQLGCAEESGFGHNHEANDGMGSTCVQKLLQHCWGSNGQQGDWTLSHPARCPQALPPLTKSRLTAAEKLLPSRATVLHLRLPTDQRCSTAPQAGRQGALLGARSCCRGLHPRQGRGVSGGPRPYSTAPPNHPLPMSPPQSQGLSLASQPSGTNPPPPFTPLLLKTSFIEM